jgi:hypothetical protein
VSSRWLTLVDIADARAYERERDAFRAKVISMKKIRRVAVGPVVSLVFENRDTIRFQVQEMARAERLYSDAALQAELDTYNPLIPAPGELSATMLIELTSREEMETWLPRLVGVERAVALEIGSGDAAEVVPCKVDAPHAAQLTREDITAAVHFVRFQLPPQQIARFPGGPVAVKVIHPLYEQSAELSAETRQALMGDLLIAGQSG